MATLKPTHRELLRAVQSGHIRRMWAGGYDWDDAAGRNVAVPIGFLFHMGLVSLPPRERGAPTSRYRLTRAGHTYLAEQTEKS